MKQSLAISRDFDQERLTVKCQRVMLLSVLTLGLNVLAAFSLAMCIPYLFSGIALIVGLVGFVFQVLMLIGACLAISEHLSRRPPERNAGDDDEVE